MRGQDEHDENKIHRRTNCLAPALPLTSPHIVLVFVLKLVLEIKAERDDEDENDDDSTNENRILVSI